MRGALHKAAADVWMKVLRMKKRMKAGNGFLRAIKEGINPFSVVGSAGHLVRRRC